MFSQTFNIVFSGQLMEGTSLEEARDKIRQLFNADDKQLSRIFSGAPVTIKTGVDDETATKYRLAFRKAGVLIDIKPSTTPTESHDTNTATQTETLTLLPPNTGSLIDCAKPVTPQPIPDISNMSLASKGSILDESPTVAPVEIDISALTLTPPNTGTLEDCKKDIAPHQIPDISHLNLDDK